MKIKAGVAGTGSMGRNHARVYSLLEGAELTAIYDQDIERAKAVADEFGGVAVSSLEELAANAQAISVAVPTVAHREVGTKLMELGCDVLMEKPIANTLEDATALIEKSHELNRILQVGHIERFNPVMRELEKRLTEPKFIEAHRLSPFPNRSMDIGVVLDVMIHDLEIILHLVKSPVVSIDAVGVNVLTHREDIANARIRFENGCVANVTASRISPERMRKLRVFQGDCYLSLDYQGQSGEMYWKEGMEIKKGEVEIEKDEPLKLELDAFVGCVARGETPAVTGQHGAAALDVALEITNKIAAGI
ncbi:Predicted dehydrogenase [Rubritalea squalenifaciens DSM 18772]|uniref:Predicted dehydrogenase n=2 Tax=Rubritalea TaxID=361050 RepID=A0A1M6GKZ7_9BACT|nr:Gfo/Idh/MocA family oxidoreductase [Rubritalea squalenifaciens]SHJ10608.1 Predicted dehydrogenase [Rubritalea squalenifaciens DSM 18772]